MTTLDNAYGMRCPNCRRSNEIDIAATVWVRLCRDGTDVAEAMNGDHEWDKDSAAVCHSCGHSGTVREFDVEHQPDANDVRAERARTALRQYVEARGEIFEDSSTEITDLIADLLHLTVRIDQGDDPVESALRLARLHFDAEHENPEETGRANAASGFIPWQLSSDHETYGDNAGKWIITSADGEQEIGHAVYATREACEDAIALLEAGRAVIDTWENGDLAAAVRDLATAVKAARRRR